MNRQYRIGMTGLFVAILLLALTSVAFAGMRNLFNLEFTMERQDAVTYWTGDFTLSEGDTEVDTGTISAYYTWSRIIPGYLVFKGENGDFAARMILTSWYSDTCAIGKLKILADEGTGDYAGLSGSGTFDGCASEGISTGTMNIWFK